MGSNNGNGFKKGNKVNLGRHLSDTTKEKLRQFNCGKKLSDKHKEAIRKAQKGRVHSEEQRRIQSESIKGKKHWNWKGGITSINYLIRHSLEYKLWRTAVFERDKYMCIWGGKEHGNKLQADHIKPFSKYPALRFAIDNGRTLCESCHRKTNTFGVIHKRV